MNNTIDFTWKIGGEAGFGIMATGAIFCKMCSRSDLNVISTAEYPSLIRGGHNNFVVRASSQEIYSLLQPVNILVALNKETIDLHKNEVGLNGMVVFDPDNVTLTTADFSHRVDLIPIPLLKLAKDNNGDALTRNTVALGVSCALLGFDFSVLQGVITDQFKRKGQEVVNHNVNTARAGYDYILNNFKTNVTPSVILGSPKGDSRIKRETDSGQARMTTGQNDKLVLTGNEAIALGAVSAGMKFFAAYPMTPINGLITFFANHDKELSVVYKQPEDEISAINMAIGASFAGVRSMVATSGGGFDLMNEGLSMAGMTETPIVAVLGQRPGPSSGLPTWTTQGDLQYALHAGHGEFFRFVLAPGDVEEAYYLTKLAFNLADQYQVPAIVLTDKYLNEGQFSLEKDRLKKSACLPLEVLQKTQVINRGKIVNNPDKTYQRYQLTPDGISPRAFPGQGMWFTANSYEHNEKGLSTEIASEIKAMVDKRSAKYKLAKLEAFGPVVYGQDWADFTLVGWGTTKQAVLETINILAQQKLKVNYLHFPCLSPFPSDKTTKLFKKAKRLVDIENNSAGQLASLIREKTGVKIEDKILKYDGRQFYPEEIISAVQVIASK